MKINLFTKNYLFIILFISLVYALIINTGFFGYGIDYWALYNKQNVSHHNIRYNLGYRITTLTLFNYKLGILITNFFLALSTGILIRYFFKTSFINSKLFFIIIFIIFIFSYPIFTSGTNAMRQGLCISFILLGLVSFETKKFILSYSLFFISFFLHKSGAAFIYIFLSSIIFFKLFNYVEKKFTKIIILITLIVIFGYIFKILLISYTNTHLENKIIAKDFTILFFIICVYFILKNMIFLNNIGNSFINVFLFVFSFCNIIVYSNGLFWQFERFSMMMLIPYIMFFCLSFKGLQKKIMLTLMTMILFLLTVYTGMYKEGVGIYKENPYETGFYEKK